MTPKPVVLPPPAPKPKKRTQKIADLVPSSLAVPPFLYGRVLEGGLGLGVLSRVILEHDAVTELVTVEKDPEVIAMFKVDDPRHTVKEGDWGAVKEKERAGFDFIVSDTGKDSGWTKTGRWNMTRGR